MQFKQLRFIGLALVCCTSFISHSTAQISSLETTTRAGNTVRITSLLAPIEINRIHSWELTLLSTDNEPIENATVSVIGGMPEHDHGLPTLPQVTQETAAGSYLVEGIRFHMPGLWEINLTIETASGTDTATLEFSL